MKIAFVTFYNNFSTGARAVAAYLNREGHDVGFIHLKAQYHRMIPRSRPDRIRLLQEANPLLGVLACDEGDYFVPYPIPLTRKEELLFLEELGRDLPDVVGFSFLWSEFPVFLRISRLVRDHFPGVRSVVGGTCAVTCPESVQQHCDAVCTGEGEEAMAEWLEDPERRDIAGMWFTRDGEVIRNRRRPLIEDLDTLPYPVYGENEVLIEEESVSRVLETDPRRLRDKWIFMSGRGCPASCSFCVEASMAQAFPRNRRSRRRSVDHFLGEIQAARRRVPLEKVHIWDSIFVRDDEWLVEFAERYPSEVGLPFYSFACPGISTRRGLDLVRRAGGEDLVIGVQCADDRMLRDIYRRPFTALQAKRCIEDAYGAGFGLVDCDFLVNSPYEDETCLERTFEFLVGLRRPVRLALSHLLRYPGTPISRIDPREDPLPEETHRFWNTLFLLTQFEGISRRGLRRIAGCGSLRRGAALVDEFLSGFVKRRRYLGRPLAILRPGPMPTREEVGTFPGMRLFIQSRFPYLYLRAQEFRRSLRSRIRPESSDGAPASATQTIRREFNAGARDRDRFPEKIDPSDGRFRLIEEVLVAANARTILDAGCGKGRFPSLLIRRNPGIRVFAADLAEKMLEHVHPGSDPVQASVSDLPYRAESFDLVFCVEVLEHAPDAARAVHDMVRCLLPGGSLVVIDKDGERFGSMETAPWERWFPAEEGSALFRKEGLSATVYRNIPHDGGDGSDGLIIAWVGRKPESEVSPKDEDEEGTSEDPGGIQFLPLPEKQC